MIATVWSRAAKSSVCGVHSTSRLRTGSSGKRGTSHYSSEGGANPCRIVFSVTTLGSTN
jgi:hypothetical protein